VPIEVEGEEPPFSTFDLAQLAAEVRDRRAHLDIPGAERHPVRFELRQEISGRRRTPTTVSQTSASS
jgi:hypothetical protein